MTFFKKVSKTWLVFLKLNYPKTRSSLCNRVVKFKPYRLDWLRVRVYTSGLCVTRKLTYTNSFFFVSMKLRINIAPFVDECLVNFILNRSKFYESREFNETPDKISRRILLVPTPTKIVQWNVHYISSLLSASSVGEKLTHMCSEQHSFIIMYIIYIFIKVRFCIFSNLVPLITIKPMFHIKTPIWDFFQMGSRKRKLSSLLWTVRGTLSST